MKLKIEIKIDNAAFHPESPDKSAWADGSEVARILRELAQNDFDDEVLRPCRVGTAFRDINGNTVGEWRVTR